jgi:asparagine synthase (glutamine-hydrolysing)
MCGIAGVLRFDGGAADACTLAEMTAAVAHRGPDGQGAFVDGPVGLGHRRLSIIDLSEAAAQPLANEDGSIQLTYNGEIYNFAELRDELIALGHRFKSRTDSEVIVHAYEEWDTACLARFNGMFAFGLWDGRTGRLWLVRDRLGVKPLFYAVLPDGVRFGSEVKAVIADAAVPRRLDHDALGCYLAFNYLPAPFTLFKDVRQVEPGHYLLIDRSGRVDDVEYWDIPFSEEGERPEREYVEELTALLSDSVCQRLVSDVPLGVFLSGGVDSSGVAYWMSRHQRDPVRSFSIGFAADSFDETPYAREVAASIGAEHRERMLGADAAAVLPAIVRHTEEPTADSSMVAVYHLAQLARQHVTVVLSGDGADDMFAGYETHQAHYLRRVYRGVPGPIRRHLIAPLVGALPPADGKVSTTEKLQRFVRAAELPSEDAHASWRMIFDEDARRRLLAPLGDAMAAAVDPLAPYRACFSRCTARHPLNRMLYVDTRLYLPADMLVKIDRMTMAHGLEAREPYLDYRVVEFAARVPPRLKLRRFTQKKYLLRKSLEGKVPARALHRRKQGFNVPKGQWMREGLREYVAERLSPARTRALGILDPAVVQVLVDEHMARRADHSHEIWSLLVLSEWVDQFAVSV